MSIVDHFSLPCPAHLLEAEIAFLTGAFACLGVRELTRPVPSVVGLGCSAAGRQVEENGSNNAFLWVFSTGGGGGGDGGEEEGARAVSSIHFALKARSKYYPPVLCSGG